MRTRQTNKCTNCFRDVPESEHHVARMTRHGMTCESCYGKLHERREMRGGIPELPKHLRVPASAGLAWEYDKGRLS